MVLRLVVCSIIGLASLFAFAEGRVCSLELERTLQKINKIYADDWQEPTALRNLGIRLFKRKAIILALEPYTADENFPATKELFERIKIVLLDELHYEFLDLGPNTFGAIIRNIENPVKLNPSKVEFASVEHPKTGGSFLIIDEEIINNPLVWFALRHEGVHMRQHFFHFLARSQIEKEITKYGEKKFLLKIEGEAFDGEYEFLHRVFEQVPLEIIEAARLEFLGNSENPALRGIEYFFERLEEAGTMSKKEYRHHRYRKLHFNKQNSGWGGPILYSLAFSGGAIVGGGLTYFLYYD